MQTRILGLLMLFFVGGVSAQNTLSFEDCLNKAYENNIQLKQSTQQLELTAISYDQSKYNLLPSFNSQVSLSNSFGRSVDPFTNAFTTDNILSTNYSLSGSVPLFAGMQRMKAIKQAKINLEKSEFDLEKTKNDVALLVASSFLQVILAEEVLEASKSRKALLVEQLATTEKMVEAGRLPVGNTLDIKAQLATEEFTLANAETQLQTSKLQLAQLIGERDYKSIELEVPQITISEAPAAINEEEVIQSAKESFPQMKSAEKNIESNELGVQIARARYYPSLSMSGVIFTGTSSAIQNYDFQNGSFQEVPIGYLTNNPSQTVSTLNFVPVVTDYPYGEQINDNIRRQISFSLNIPILNGFSTRLGVKQSRVQLEMAKLNYQNTQNQLQNDVQKAYLDVQSSYENYKAAVAQAETMEQALKNAKVRFDNNMLSGTDYRVALNNKTKAESDLIQAKFRYVFNTKILDFYLGNDIKF